MFQKVSRCPFRCCALAALVMVTGTFIARATSEAISYERREREGEGILCTKKRIVFRVSLTRALQTLRTVEPNMVELVLWLVDEAEWEV